VFLFGKMVNMPNKKIKIGILICAVLLIVFSVISWYVSEHKFVKVKDNHLDPKISGTYQNRLEDLNYSLTVAKTDDAKFDIEKQIGTEQYLLGLLNDSKQSYEAAINLKPNDYTGYVGLFRTQIDMKDLDGAKLSIAKALSLNSSTVDVWIPDINFEEDVLHSSPVRINDLYVQALSKTNSNIGLMTAYAYFEESQNKFETAKEYWQKALQIDPKNKDYQAQFNRLSNLLKQQK
jgi:tetratricopeptide (TPR) repeat protein